MKKTYEAKGKTREEAIDAGLAASIFHFGEVAIPDLKAELKKNGILVRTV